MKLNSIEFPSNDRFQPEQYSNISYLIRPFELTSRTIEPTKATHRKSEIQTQRGGKHRRIPARARMLVENSQLDVNLGSRSV